MKKNFVLDTNVLLHDPRALFQFEDNNVILPIYVIEELDSFKKDNSELGRNARWAARQVDQFRQKGQLSGEGVLIGEEGTLRVLFASQEQLHADHFHRVDSPDSKILAVALTLKKQEPDRPVIVISKDTNLRIRANALGLDAEDYEPEATTIDELYTGFQEYLVPGDLIDSIYEQNTLQLDALRSMLVEEGEGQDLVDEQGPEAAFAPNAFFLLKDAANPKHSAVARLAPNGRDLAPLSRRGSEQIWGLWPRNKEQRFALDLLLDERVKLVSLVGKAGTGKAQPLDAPILTPDGWMKMGSMEPGRSVLTPDGTPAKVLAVYPQGQKEIYRVVFSDGSSTECCKEHLWLTWSRADGETESTATVKSLEDIMRCLRHGRMHNHTIPMVQPIEASEADVPVEPYCAAVLLAMEGALEAHGQLLPDFFSQQTHSTLQEKYVLLQDFMEEHETCGRIPLVYQNGSIAQRTAFLQGWMDVHGTWTASDGFQCEVDSLQSADVLRSVIQSLGGTAAFVDVPVQQEAKKTTFSLHVCVPEEITLFRESSRREQYASLPYKVPSRSIDYIEFAGVKEAQCILIDHPEHLYLTDDFIVTHNTLLAIAAGLQQTVEENMYQKLIVSRPIFPLGRDLGFLPGTLEEKLLPWMKPIFDNVEFLMQISAADKRKRRGAEELMALGMLQVEPLTYIRGRSIPHQFMIIDEAQNLTPHEIKTIVTRVGEGTKIVLTGDPYQIDHPYLDAAGNGLVHTVQRLQHSGVAGHITLQKGERSELAELAANLL